MSVVAAHVVELPPGVAVDAATLELGLAEAIACDASAVVVDLKRSSAIDSTSLGILLRAARRLRANGRALTILVEAPEIVRLFASAGLDRLFEIVWADDGLLPCPASRGVAQPG